MSATPTIAASADDTSCSTNSVFPLPAMACVMCPYVAANTPMYEAWRSVGGIRRTQHPLDEVHGGRLLMMNIK
jgi:hypothetical protein